MYLLCLGEEKKLFNEIMHFHYNNLYNLAPAQDPCPKGHEIYNFGIFFLGHHNFILILSVLCLGVEKWIFKEIMHFHYMT